MKKKEKKKTYLASLEAVDSKVSMVVASTVLYRLEITVPVGWALNTNN